MILIHQVQIQVADLIYLTLIYVLQCLLPLIFKSCLMTFPMSFSIFLRTWQFCKMYVFLRKSMFFKICRLHFVILFLWFPPSFSFRFLRRGWSAPRSSFPLKGDFDPSTFGYEVVSQFFTGLLRQDSFHNHWGFVWHKTAVSSLNSVVVLKVWIEFRCWNRWNLRERGDDPFSRGWRGCWWRR